eukprot:6177818-Pleurochrysis_carterae.AAC.1
MPLSIGLYRAFPHQQSGCLGERRMWRLTSGNANKELSQACARALVVSSLNCCSLFSRNACKHNQSCEQGQVSAEAIERALEASPVRKMSFGAAGLALKRWRQRGGGGAPGRRSLRQR